MDRSEAFDKVVRVVVSQLDVDAATVTEASSFIDDLGADSLDLVELVMAFEDEFEVTIPDDKVESIKSVGDAVLFMVSQG